MGITGSRKHIWILKLAAKPFMNVSGGYKIWIQDYLCISKDILMDIHLLEDHTMWTGITK